MGALAVHSHKMDAIQITAERLCHVRISLTTVILSQGQCCRPRPAVQAARLSISTATLEFLSHPCLSHTFLQFAIYPTPLLLWSL